MKLIIALTIAAAAFLAAAATAPEPACASGNCGGYCSEEQLVCPIGCGCNFVTNNCICAPPPLRLVPPLNFSRTAKGRETA
jgi:hypothetical protein